MSRVIVFHNEGIWFQTDGPAEFTTCPEGSYVRRKSSVTGKIYWDHVSEGNAQSIQYDSLPAWVKMWALVLT